MYSRKHVRDLAIGFGVTLLIVTGFTLANAASAEEAKGTGRSIDIARENSLTSAHFTCNKQGLWADPDTLVEVGTTSEKFRLAGGHKKLTYITVDVTFDCTTEFKKDEEETTS